VGISQTSPGAKLTVNNPTTAGKTGASGDGIYVYVNSANAALSAEQANASGYAGYFSGKVLATNQLISTIAGGTAPLAVTSNTKVANLNADFLDGYDSSAFGDATLANQTTILNRIGQASDAASMDTTLFAGQQYLWDNRASFGSQTASTSYIVTTRGADATQNEYGGIIHHYPATFCPSGWTIVTSWTYAIQEWSDQVNGSGYSDWTLTLCAK
jgi:hypothetical protein